MSRLIPKQLKTMWDLETPEQLLSIPGERDNKHIDSEADKVAVTAEESELPSFKTECPGCHKNIYYDEAKPKLCPYCGVNLIWH